MSINTENIIMYWMLVMKGIKINKHIRTGGKARLETTKDWLRRAGRRQRRGSRDGRAASCLYALLSKQHLLLTDSLLHPTFDHLHDYLLNYSCRLKWTVTGVLSWWQRRRVCLFFHGYIKCVCWYRFTRFAGTWQKYKFDWGAHSDDDISITLSLKSSPI